MPPHKDVTVGYVFTRYNLCLLYLLVLGDYFIFRKQQHHVVGRIEKTTLEKSMVCIGLGKFLRKKKGYLRTGWREVERRRRESGVPHLYFSLVSLPYCWHSFRLRRSTIAWAPGPGKRKGKRKIRLTWRVKGTARTWRETRDPRKRRYILTSRGGHVHIVSLSLGSNGFTALPPLLC